MLFRVKVRVCVWGGGGSLCSLYCFQIYHSLASPSQLALQASVPTPSFIIGCWCSCSKLGACGSLTLSCHPQGSIGVLWSCLSVSWLVSWGWKGGLCSTVHARIPESAQGLVLHPHSLPLDLWTGGCWGCVGMLFREHLGHIHTKKKMKLSLRQRSWLTQTLQLPLWSQPHTVTTCSM